MCVPKSANITKVCGKTYIKGQKPNLFVSHIDEVTAIPAADADSLTISSAVTFRSAVTGPPAIPAGQWWKWQCSKVDGSYSATPEGDADNPTIKVSVEAFIYGITAGRTYTIGQTLGHEYLVVACDNEGNNRLIGELGRGATITVTEQTADKNGYKVLITWETGSYPYFYTAALPN